MSSIMARLKKIALAYYFPIRSEPCDVDSLTKEIEEV